VAFEEISPRPEVLLFTRKSFIIDRADLRDLFRKTFKSVCTSAIVIYPESLSPEP
jgi:hypothetical protein